MFSNRGNYTSDIFDDFRRLQQQMDQLVNSSWPAGIRSVARGTYPPINVASNNEQVEIFLFIAGVDPDKLDITIQQNLLTIAGERGVNKKEQSNYYRKERFSGPFRRVVTLPDDVDPEKVTAAYRNGVLQVSVQRRESAKPRQIKIQ